jgi:hypothetical protein
MNAFLVASIVVPAVMAAIAINVAYHDAKRAKAKKKADAAANHGNSGAAHAH